MPLDPIGFLTYFIAFNTQAKKPQKIIIFQLITAKRLTFNALHCILQRMIKTFSDKTTAAVFADERVRQFPTDILQIARRKLNMLDKAERIDDLRIPPGNRLEALTGDRTGQWSIRINQQWRLCFRFENGNAYDVQIIDYH